MKLLFTIVLGLLTSASIAWVPHNPVNPKLYNPLYVSNTTDAQFGIAQGYGFTVGASTWPVIALSSETNIYFEDDGNLRVYDPTGVLWSTNLPARDCSTGVSQCYLRWQADGNLVIYVEGVAVWNTGTGGVGQALTFSSRGSLVWITGNGSPAPVLWSSGVVGNGAPGDKQDVCTGVFCTMQMCPGCPICWTRDYGGCR
ncbi:MAG: hypothetical protein Q9170_000822 [Blastenia crenularia]